MGRPCGILEDACYVLRPFGRSLLLILVPAGPVAAAAAAAAAVVAATVVAATAAAATVTVAIAAEAAVIVVAAGIAAGVADKIRENNPIDIGRTEIAGHKISSKEISWKQWLPRHLMPQFARRSLPKLESQRVIEIDAPGVLLRVGPCDGIPVLRHRALDRRQRQVPDLVYRRLFRFLFHVLTPRSAYAVFPLLFPGAAYKPSMQNLVFLI